MIQGNSLTNLLESIERQQPIKYGDCLTAVEKNMTVLKTIEVSREVRIKLKNTLEKMSDVAAENKKFVAKPFPRISKFFHKLGQLLKGHGFQTRKEYGLMLANELDAINKSIWRQELKKYLEGKPLDFVKMMDAIKSIPMDQFNDFIKIYIETNSVTIGQHKKLQIFRNLKEEQQNAIKTKYVNENWYIPMFRILKGSTEAEINEFISEPMIARFTSNPRGFMFAWSHQRYLNESQFENLVQAVLVRGFRKYLETNDTQAKKWMLWLLYDKEFGEDIIGILRTKLTQEEFTRLPG